MSFKEEHPNYKSYNSPSGYYFHDVPYTVWSEFESLVVKAGGAAGECLQMIVSRIAAEAGAGTVPIGYAYQYISDVVSKLRIKTESGKFPLFMDCLALLCDEGELLRDDLNEFLEEYKIGYRAVDGVWKHDIVWDKIEDDEDDSNIFGNSSSISLKGADFFKSTKELSGVEERMKATNRPTKIFITHSSKDTEYVLILTTLLRNLKVPTNSIVCTSDPRHKIPNGENAYIWLREQFMESDLHMIFVLSENYYKSNPCLNEMGAAWLVSKRSDLLLLPGFGFGDLKKKDGCLDKDIQGGSIDSSDKMLKAWLNNLRDDIINEFGLEKPDEYDWEDYRDAFINGMRSVGISKPKNEGTGSVRNEVHKLKPVQTTSKESDSPVIGKDDVGIIPVDSAFLLVYAASGNGQIIKIQPLGSPVQVSAAGKQFMADNSNRESARWVEALDRLISWGWVKPVGHKGQVFALTGTGYSKADWLKDGMQINTENEPLDELKEFE